MEMEIKRLKQMTIQEFADKHKLVMVAEQIEPKKWLACFKNAETLNDIFLRSEAGYGPTMWDAVKDYARIISNETLVVDACNPGKRLLIPVPILTVSDEGA